MQELVRRAGAHLAGPEEGRLAVSQAHWAALRDKTLSALEEEHARAPDMIGVSRERLRRLALPALDQGPFDHLVAELLAEGRIEQSGPWLHAPGHSAKLAPNEARLWASIHPLLEEVPFHPPRVRDLAHALATEEEVMRRLLKSAARIGEVYPVANDHYFTHQALIRLAEIVRRLTIEFGEASAGNFRDRIGTGRKLAIQILEFFDRVGFTRRVADGHVLRQPALFAQEAVDGAGR